MQIKIGKQRFGLIAAAIPIALNLFVPSLADAAPKFSLPVDCDPGKDCWVQNLVDMDAGPERVDPFCGKVSFNTHKGTDFRVADVTDLRKGVDILAPADGRIVGLRDGVADRLVTNKSDVAKIKGIECGNGVVIAHGDGWTTQLCHMARGSVNVKKGDKVRRGQVVGKMGLSGHTTFPHIHITVRRGKKIIDPMSGLPQTARCQPRSSVKLPEAALWDSDTQKKLARPMTALIKTGFAGAPVGSRDVLQSNIKPVSSSGPMVFFVQFINVRKGDRIDLSVDGPNGRFAQSKGKPIPGAKANWTVYAGKKGAVPKGATFTGNVRLIRDGEVVIEQSGVAFQLQ